MGFRIPPFQISFYLSSVPVPLNKRGKLGKRDLEWSSFTNSTKFSLTVRHRHFAMQKQKTLARKFAYGKRRVRSPRSPTPKEKTEATQR